MYDRTGDALATPATSDQLAEYVNRGTVNGARGYSIGVLYRDTRGNDVAESLEREYVRSFLMTHRGRVG